jgi:putative ABC transport system permease protein
MLKLALRNVFRHGIRTAVTLMAVMFGVAGLIVSGGFVQDIFLQLGEAVIHSQSGHLQISMRGFQAEGTRKPTQYLIEAPERLKGRVAHMPGVADAMARMSFTGLLNNGRSDLAVVGEGVEPAHESRLGTYMKIVAGRALEPRDRNGVMLGSGVAHALKLTPGDRATLVVSTPEGAANTMDLEVVGVFQTFSKDFDARAVRISLAAAQEAMDTRGANVIVVTLGHTENTAAVADLLRAQLASEGLELATWQELNDFYAKTVDLYDQQFAVLRIIILVMVLLSAANSINMSVFERVAEFGTMRALGNRSRTVFGLVATESLLLGLTGAALGMIVGVVLAAAISAIGIPMPPPPNADLGYTAHIQVSPGVVFTSFAVGCLATACAGIIAALRVARIPVVDALRQGV